MSAVATDRRVQRPAELRGYRRCLGNAGREHRSHSGAVLAEAAHPALGATGLESGMNESNGSALPEARGSLDDIDLGILNEIEGLYNAADPPPTDLVERVRFALALEEVNAEVLRLQEETERVAARGDEPSRTIPRCRDDL